MEQVQGGIQQRLDDKTGQPRGGRAKKDAKGRKDGDQEQVPDKDELAKGLPALKKLLEAREAASTAVSKKVKALAKASGFNADVVRALAKAYAGEKEDREVAIRKAEQLSLAFEVLSGVEE